MSELQVLLTHREAAVAGQGDDELEPRILNAVNSSIIFYGSMLGLHKTFLYV